MLKNMEINKTEVNIVKVKPSEIICTFCMKQTCQDFANVQQKTDLLELLKKLNIDIKPIDGQIDWICYQCTYKLNCIRDYARTWASCVTKNRINYYYRLGEKEMVRRLLNLKNSKPLRSLSNDGGSVDQNETNNENELKIKISSVRSIGASDIPKIITIDDDDDDESVHQQYRSQHDDYQFNNDDNKQDEPELLSVMYEKSESVILTESGHNTRSRRKKTSTPTLLTCKQCHRVYKKLSFLKKHERKHERDLLLKSNITIAQNTKKIKKIIKCKECDITFKTLKSWRRHNHIHQAKLQCKNCKSKFELTIELEDHKAYCWANQNVQSNQEVNSNKKSKGKKNGQVNKPQHRYMTRSMKHRIINNDSNTEDDNISDNMALADLDSMYTKRLNFARNWVDNTRNDHQTPKNIDEIREEEIINNDDDCESIATSFTRMSSRLDFTEYEGDDDEIEDFDNLSALTRPSAPTKYTTKRLKKRLKEPDTVENEDDDDDLSKLTRPSPSSKYTRERLKKRIKEPDISYENDRKRFKISQYECPERNCNFETDQINRLIEHDLALHDQLPLHSCKKCKGRFVRLLYLDHHICDQNAGRFICTQCKLIFSLESDLKHHKNYHNVIQIDNNSNYCKYCHLYFTNTSDYCKHLEMKKHCSRDYTVDEKFQHDEIENKLKHEINEETVVEKESETQEIQVQSQIDNDNESEEDSEAGTEIGNQLEIEKESVLKKEKTKIKQLKKNIQKDLIKDENIKFNIEQIKKDFKLKEISKIENIVGKTEKSIDEKNIIKSDNIVDKLEKECNEENLELNSTVFAINIFNDNSEIIKQRTQAQPYKSEIKIRHFYNIRRNRNEIFRRWKPHREPLFVKGTNYYDCGVKPSEGSLQPCKNKK